MTSYSDSVSHQKKPPQQCQSGGQHTLVNHICLKGQYFKCRLLITLSQTTKTYVPILLVQAAAEWFRIPVFRMYIWDVKYKWINVGRGRGCEVWECVTGAWNSWSPLLGKKREKSLISHNMTRCSMQTQPVRNCTGCFQAVPSLYAHVWMDAKWITVTQTGRWILSVCVCVWKRERKR